MHLLKKNTKLNLNNGVDLLFLILFILFYCYLNIKLNVSSYKNNNIINYLNDIDLTSSTDFEDFAVIISDSIEFIEQDRSLFMDGGFELGILRSLNNNFITNSIR